MRAPQRLEPLPLDESQERSKAPKNLESATRTPRDMARDVRLYRKAGVDVISAPDDKQMYPRAGAEDRQFGLHNIQRFGDHRGNAAEVRWPRRAFHAAREGLIGYERAEGDGAKDYQQGAIVKRMVRDLNFLLKIMVAPILREACGLAMSSQNKYLVGELRAQALVLRRSLEKPRAEVRKSSRPVPAARLKAELKRFIERAPAARLDHVEFFEPDTLVPVPSVTRGTQMALAVFVGKTRLIDNARL